MTARNELTYDLKPEFRNLVYTESELNEKLNTADEYWLEKAAKNFVRSRLYVGLAVRANKWSYCFSDDYRYGVDRQVLALNLVSGEVSWVSDGGDDEGHMTRGCIPLNATPEQREQAWKWLSANGGTAEDRKSHETRLKAIVNHSAFMVGEAASNALRVTKGSRVKIVKGRKVPVGTTGTVVWMGQSQYGTRVGISPSGVRMGKIYPDVVWTALTNVEVDDPALAMSAEVSGKIDAAQYLALETANAKSHYESLVGGYKSLVGLN